MLVVFFNSLRAQLYAKKLWVDEFNKPARICARTQAAAKGAAFIQQ